MLKELLLQAALVFGQTGPASPTQYTPDASAEHVTVIKIRPAMRLAKPIVRASGAELPDVLAIGDPEKLKAPAKDAPKKDAPKKDAPKKDAPKKDAPKKDAPKKDAPKKDAAPAKDAPPAKDACPTKTIIIDESGAPCKDSGSRCGSRCDIRWCIPWKCEDLDMKEVEKKPCSACDSPSFLWCPKEEEKNGCEKKNGNGEEKKDGNGNGEEKKDGNGNGEEKKDGNGNGEEKEPSLPLTALLDCLCPGLADCSGEPRVKAYGWLQGGFTGNWDSPRDRLNYGVNFNNRSNDVMLNQAYMVLEKPLDLDKKKDEFHCGFRVDFYGGHDSFATENFNGPFKNFLGDSLEASSTADIGISLPQFYVDAHLPVLTERGVDLRVGRMYTLMGLETYPAPTTMFYSHSYEFFYACPFTHLAAMATVHVADTLDLTGGIIRGWDVAFDDNNDHYSFHGAINWTSCDKRSYFVIATCIGPEQTNNNDNNRTLITAYYTRKMGDRNQWTFITGGHMGWEQNATLDATSTARSAEWYGSTTHMHYAINPALSLGIRGEWFHDDDGSRTVFTNSDNGGARWNRPGYAGSFYECTVGATWKPFKNLRIRPEVRCDWFDGSAIDGSFSQPFNDQTDKFQITTGFDMIYEF